jgi:hypothetical protein
MTSKKKLLFLLIPSEHFASTAELYRRSGLSWVKTFTYLIDFEAKGLVERVEIKCGNNRDHIGWKRNVEKEAKFEEEDDE